MTLDELIGHLNTLRTTPLARCRSSGRTPSMEKRTSRRRQSAHVIASEMGRRTFMSARLEGCRRAWKRWTASDGRTLSARPGER
jgi:hypothetical protein